MIGPLLAGLVIDNFDPRILWYIAGIVGMFATLIYLLLHRQVREDKLVEMQAAEG